MEKNAQGKDWAQNGNPGAEIELVEKGGEGGFKNKGFAGAEAEIPVSAVRVESKC
jgi:hypothetical protein